MASSQLNVQTQARLRAQLAEMNADPGFTALALKAINQWGRDECVLQYAVFLALKDAYAAGVRGEPPEAPEPSKEAAPRTVQRTRTVRPAQPASAEPQRPTNRLIRRAR